MINETTQKVFWNKTNKRRNPDHPVVKAFATPKIDFIRNCIESDCGKDQIKQILDAGSGNGFFTYQLAKWGNCTALDFSERMLELNPVTNINKVCGNILEMDFPDNSFDLVFCSNLLHHVSDPLKAVAEMTRVSEKYVAISEPNRNNPLMFAFSLIKSVERGILKFNSAYLLKIASQNGLRPISIKTMGAVLPNKTPKPLLPFFKAFDTEFPMAFFNVMICRKEHD